MSDRAAKSNFDNHFGSNGRALELFGVAPPIPGGWAGDDILRGRSVDRRIASSPVRSPFLSVEKSTSPIPEVALFLAVSINIFNPLRKSSRFWCSEENRES